MFQFFEIRQQISDIIQGVFYNIPGVALLSSQIEYNFYLAEHLAKFLLMLDRKFAVGSLSNEAAI